jgi:putative membrane protein
MFGLLNHRPSLAERIVEFIIEWIILAFAVWAAAEIIPGIHLEGVKSIIIVAGILGLLNAFLKPVLQLVTIPLTIITLGLFLIVINALLLALTDWITDGISGVNFEIDSFWDAILGAIIISLVTFVISRFVDTRDLSRDLTPHGL